MTSDYPEATHHTEQTPASENQVETTQAQLEGLLTEATAVFDGIGERVDRISEQHVESRAEVETRGNVRRASLARLSNVVGEVLERGSISADDYNRMQEIEEQARDGHRIVLEQTKYLYSPASALDTADGLVRSRGRLEQQTRQYAALETAHHDNLPDNLFEGFKGIDYAISVIEALSGRLTTMYRRDEDLQDAFSQVRRTLNSISLHYDETEVRSLLRQAKEALGCAEDADRAREQVHTQATELHPVVEMLRTAARLVES